MSAQPTSIAPESETLDAAIGRRVHQLMWDRQVTQTVFAEMIGMDQSSVAKRLRGKLGWSAKHVAQASEALNVSISYLFGETENPHQSPDGGDSSRLRDLNARPVLYKGNPSHEAIITPIRKAA